jgi:WD40 repeat protein
MAAAGQPSEPGALAGSTRSEPCPLDGFTRHRGPVTCAVAIPGHGRGCEQIVSSGYDGAVAIADVTRQTISLLGYHDHLVNRIALSPSGRLAASPSSDYTIGLWDLATRRRVRTLSGHSDDVEDFVFVDDATGVSASRDRRVLVWDLETGAIRRALLGHDRDVLSLAYGGWVFSSGDDMTLRAWDLETGELVRCWGPFAHETDTCAIDLRRDRVILGCDDGVIRIFAIGSGRSVGEIAGHASGVKRVCVSPVDGHILSAAYDQRLVVWDADDLSERLVLESAPSAWERSFNWAPDGSAIVAGTFDGTILGWDAHSGRRLFEIGDPGGNACFNDVAPAAELVATVADDGLVRLGRLSRSGAAWVASREPAAGRVLANAVTADSSAGVVVAGFHDQTLRIFACDETLAELAATSLGEGPINSVRVSAAGGERHIFAACYSGCVARLSIGGELLSRFRVHDGAVKSLRVLPSRGIGVSCSADGSAYAWSLETGEHQLAFPGHTAIVNDIDVDPAGTRIATVGRDFSLDVHSLDSGHLLQAYPLPRRSPKSVVFATDDTVVIGDYWGYVVRVSLDGGVSSRRRIAANGISALARHDGAVMASSYDGQILLVDVATLEVVAALRAMWQRPAPPARGLRDGTLR